MQRALTEKQVITPTYTLQLYNPHRVQKLIHQSKAQFNIACWGRQSGKTTYGINKMLHRAWTGPKNGTYWFILQTWSAAQVAYRRMKYMLSTCNGSLAQRPHDTEMRLVLVNGAVITFKSGANFENLRSESLTGCIIDEVRQQNPALWPRIIQPMLAKSDGWCDFLSTPNGFDHFYDMYDRATKTSGRWAAFYAPSWDAPWWTPHLIEEAKVEMSQAEFEQEIGAQFRDIKKDKAYFAHGIHNQKDACVFDTQGRPFSPYLPLIVGLDFNVNPMAWTIKQNKGTDWWIGKELYLENTDTQQAAETLIPMLKDHKPGIIVCGDASGNARKTSASGNTDYSIIEAALKDANIKHENITPDSNPFVKDRVNIINSKLMDGAKVPHLFYNPETCPKVKRDFDRVTWKKGDSWRLDSGIDKDLGHITDALGYPICQLTDTFKQPIGDLIILAN